MDILTIFDFNRISEFSNNVPEICKSPPIVQYFSIRSQSIPLLVIVNPSEHNTL
ncbi:MAG TPA: hypothetical protein P5513_04515 [Candidatus Diapherotrites archaeon]|nr:hypothetical protein [Candidatus Diapherotrites archaeon]